VTGASYEMEEFLSALGKRQPLNTVKIISGLN